MIVTWNSQLQYEYNEMVKGVEENKGFYIGRYETSLRQTTDENGNIKKISQSVSGKTSANSITANTWYGLYQIEKEYSENNDLTELVGSSMVWGSQYDQMMIWMQNSGIEVTSATPITGASKNTTRITGSKEEDKLNNIYDLMGNSLEWILESSNTNKRTVRRWILR